MPASITFFPVSNGDMTLIRLDNGQNIIIDLNIRGAADDDDDDTADVAADLRGRLKRDKQGRLYVDAFLLSHPDQDHITGLRNHFHLGPPDEWSEDDNKIFIREMWSSPIVFRRASPNHTLCDDAKAWATEARRRVARFREDGLGTAEGDRILIMGEDVDGKTDDILDIVVKIDETFSACNRAEDGAFEGRLLGPLAAENDEDEEELEKNDSSVILRFSLTGGGVSDKCRFLTGGDAGVAIWKRLWQRHGKENADWLSYDVAQTPHHCSWRSLSFDRWSELGEKVKVDLDAREALGQTRKGAAIIASSKPIKKDDDNPPHERAKREYIDILGGDSERFYCTDEFWADENHALEFEIKASGITRKLAKAAALAAPALDLAHDRREPAPGVAQSFLHGPKGFPLRARLYDCESFGGDAEDTKAWPIKIAPLQGCAPGGTPQHQPALAGEKAGKRQAEAGRRPHVPFDLVQGTAPEPAPRQGLIDRGDPERRCSFRALQAAARQGGETGAKRGKVGTGVHEAQMFLKCSH